MCGLIFDQYLFQWMEKSSTGSCMFRNNRAEQREAAKFAENRQKTLEALLAKIQAKFEKSDGKIYIYIFNFLEGYFACNKRKMSI